MYGFELLGRSVRRGALSSPSCAVPRRKGRARREALPRLGVYLTDTLAEPGAAAPAGVLGFVTEGIRDERKRGQPHQEPSSRSSPSSAIHPIAAWPSARTRRSSAAGWMTLWDDLKAPGARRWLGQPAQHLPRTLGGLLALGDVEAVRGHNAPKRGVVAFITNRKFLTGKPYAGLRKMMRERFDRHRDHRSARRCARGGAGRRRGRPGRVQHPGRHVHHPCGGRRQSSGGTLADIPITTVGCTGNSREG